MRLKRIIVLIAIVALVGATVAAATTTGAKVKLGKTNLGKILENHRGFTLYMFTRDTSSKEKCQGIQFCTQAWPPLLTKAKPVAGTGIQQSLLHTIKLHNGKRQVTYNGHPLYTYSADLGPGQTSYVGAMQYGGRWYALNANGKAVK